MATPNVHLSFIGDRIVITADVATDDVRSYTADELRAMGFLSPMHAMFLDRMRDQLFALARQLPSQVGEHT